MITNTFLASLLPGATADGQTRAVNTSQAVDSAFKNMMDKATDGTRTETRRSENVERTSRTERNDKRWKEDTVSDKAGARDKKAVQENADSPKSNTVSRQKEKSGVKASEVQEADNSADKDSPEKAINKLLEEISEALGVTMSALMQMLQSMQIQPTDLVNPENLNRLMQMANNVDTAAELLKIDGVTDAMKQIRAALSAFEQNQAAQSLRNVAMKSDISAQEMVEYVQANQDLTGNAVLGDESEGASGQIEASNEENVASGGIVNTQGGSLSTANAGINDAVSATQQATMSTAAKSMSSASETLSESQEIDEDIDLQINMSSGTREASHLAQGVSRAQSTQRTVSNQDVINQILDRMRVEFKGDVSEIRLALRPQHLGDVSLKIATENGVVTAQFVAESQRVKEIIESSFNQLKDMLKQQGVEVSELQVSVRQENQGQRQEQLMEEFLREQQRSGRRIRNILSGIEEGELDISELPLAPREDEDSNVEYMA